VIGISLISPWIGASAIRYIVICHNPYYAKSAQTPSESDHNVCTRYSPFENSASYSVKVPSLAASEILASAA
jgi:hypothetical protein